MPKISSPPTTHPNRVSRIVPAGYATVIAAIVGILLLPLWSASSRPPKAVEALSFEVSKFPVQHQGPQVIDLQVRLGYVSGIEPKQYPDFEVLYREIIAFMNAYPNETDYWEVFNKAICMDLLNRHAVVSSVDIDLRVHPTFGIQYSHTSHCGVSR